MHPDLIGQEKDAKTVEEILPSASHISEFELHTANSVDDRVSMYSTSSAMDNEFTPAIDVDVSQPVVSESHTIIPTNNITQLVDTDQDIIQSHSTKDDASLTQGDSIVCEDLVDATNTGTTYNPTTSKNNVVMINEDLINPILQQEQVSVENQTPFLDISTPANSPVLFFEKEETFTGDNNEVLQPCEVLGVHAQTAASECQQLSSDVVGSVCEDAPEAQHVDILSVDGDTSNIDDAHFSYKEHAVCWEQTSENQERLHRHYPLHQMAIASTRKQQFVHGHPALQKAAEPRYYHR
jgi:hypothetical protein